MGMSTYAVGIREKTMEVIDKRKAVEALVKAGVEVPEELVEFFGGRDPDRIIADDAAGLEVDILHSEGGDDSSSWVDVAVKDIPKGVDRIRFTNSW